MWIKIIEKTQYFSPGPNQEGDWRANAGIIQQLQKELEIFQE